MVKLEFDFIGFYSIVWIIVVVNTYTQKIMWCVLLMLAFTTAAVYVAGIARPADDQTGTLCMPINHEIIEARKDILG